MITTRLNVRRFNSPVQRLKTTIQEDINHHQVIKTGLFPEFSETKQEVQDIRPVIPRKYGYNFGGGPGAVREEVRTRAAIEMLEGGILETSHREPGPVHSLLTSTQDLIKNLLDIPKEDYSILFTHGGAHAQFSAIPLNFGENPTCVSCITGSWSQKASNEQKKFAQVFEIKPKVFTSQSSILDPFKTELQNRNADYGYFCTNETMQGIQVLDDSLLPDSASLVADATSDLFSRQIDISKYACIFASGGKNLGPAGVGLVIVRNDFLNDPKIIPSTKLPMILSWREYANSKPVQNIASTPPMLNIGLSRMFLDDLAKRGGVAVAEKRTIAFSNALYDEIDSSNGFYENLISKEIRSRVSVTFRIPNSIVLENKFIVQAEKRGLLQLMNHPMVGGMRASLYNGIPTKAVEELLVFMRDFRLEYNV